MDSTVFTEDQLNFFRICYIASDILLQGLRFLFKQEWDKRYKTKFGEWIDIPDNGKAFEKIESSFNPEEKVGKINGNRAKWDSSMLFYAILFSNCIGSNLDSRIRSNVHELRKFRNEDFAHITQGQLSELDFRVVVDKVESAFKKLRLPTAGIEAIRNQKSFQTHELLDKLEKIEISEEQREVLECQLMNKAESFCVPPPIPSHPIASRDRDVAKVIEMLSNLKKGNADRLSYCYISGNPGSGKSQLARLVAEKFYERSIKDTSALSFVMTLRAESLKALKESYGSLARHLGWPKHTVDKTLASKGMTPEQKINNLKDLIATKIHLYTSWLLVVDNVTNVACTHVFLPELGNKQWGNGQLLITTQDSNYIPTDCSLTSEISISEGMVRADARCFLVKVSGVTDHDLEDEVIKALDYQPLAIAGAGTYVKQVRDTNPSFGLKDYLEKLQQGKRALTEKQLVKTNQSYPHSMTTAIRIAAERVMNSDEVMKHAFTFLALCAPDLLKLDILTNYILNVDKKQDKEDIGLLIQGSSLLLMEKEEDGVYVRLHQVVYDTVKLLVEDCMEIDTEVRAADAAVKSFNQFIEETMPEGWLQFSCVDESRRVVPHLKTLAVEIGNIFSAEKKYQFLMSNIVDVSLCNNHFATLGIICTQHVEFNSAKHYFNAAITLIEKHGLQQVDVARTYHHLSILEYQSDNFLEAKRHLEHALYIRLQQLGPEHIDVARTYHHLGNLYIYWKNFQTAKEHYECAQSIQKKLLHAEHVEFVRTYHNLGIVHRNLKDYQLARKHYEYSLPIYKKTFGHEHVEVARAYHHVGVLEHVTGNHQLAMKYYEHAVSIQEKNLGPEHLKVSHIYHSMGVLQKELGNHELAKKHLERALSIQRKTFGENHSGVVANKYHLGTLKV